MRCSHLNPLNICLAVDIILSIITILDFFFFSAWSKIKSPGDGNTEYEQLEFSHIKCQSLSCQEYFCTESAICYCRYVLGKYMFEGTLLNLIIEANSEAPDWTDPK